jgi:hypothetical protein
MVVRRTLLRRLIVSHLLEEFPGAGCRCELTCPDADATEEPIFGGLAFVIGAHIDGASRNTSSEDGDQVPAYDIRYRSGDGARANSRRDRDRGC